MTWPRYPAPPPFRAALWGRDGSKEEEVVVRWEGVPDCGWRKKKKSDDDDDDDLAVANTQSAYSTLWSRRPISAMPNRHPWYARARAPSSAMTAVIFFFSRWLLLCPEPWLSSKLKGIHTDTTDGYNIGVVERTEGKPTERHPRSLSTEQNGVMRETAYTKPPATQNV